MRELDKIAEALFNKIRARFDSVTIGDNKAQSTTDSEKARFFNFDYINQEGKNFGNITISLIDENSLKIYFGNNISLGLSGKEQQEWYAFLRELRQFAKRNMLMFDTRDINRSNLDLKDLQQQSKSGSTYDKEELSISEGKLYGTSRSSYADVGPHKLIIRHNDKVDPDRHGSRGRKIEHIFVETPLGERFLLPHTNLHGARALANHMRHGGKIDDTGTNLINEMVKEMSSMRHFVRSMRSRTFEDNETSGMVESAIHRYNEIKDNLKKFQGRKGHELLLTMTENSWTKNNDEIDVEGLKERFVKKIYDDRFNEALPYVYRAYQSQLENATPASKEFESWANEITHEDWDDSDQQASIEFVDIVEKPIQVGVDGIDAIAALKDTFDDAELSSALQKLAASQGPDADARKLLAGWLASNGETELANLIVEILKRQNQPIQVQPTSPSVPKQNFGATTTDEPVVSEDIQLLKWLAGVKK
jgi:hypothetical protein